MGFWNFILWMLAGMGAGLIVLPIFMSIFLFIRKTKERIKIKRMIKRGQFLIPIDPKDYDVNAWKNEIDSSKYTDRLNNLDKEIFKR